MADNQTRPSVPARPGVRPGAKPPPGAVAKGVKGKAVPDKAPSTDNSPLNLVMLRNEFYRDGYRTMLRVVLILSAIIVLQTGAMYYVIRTHQPENRYFATTEDGRLMPMVPLTEPNLSPPALMSWVAQAASETLTFGFNDYRRRLQESSRNFTRRGWQSFTDALQRSKIIDLVEQNEQVISAVPKGAPILMQEGINAGRYQWTVQMPIILTYQSAAKTRSDSLLLTLVIVRVPRLESPNGVGIEQWIAVPG